MRSVVPLLLVASLAAAGRAPLTGKVTDASGKPLEHATVMVYHAAVKTGYSTFCPSCYADCGKRAVTNAEGAFTIPNLDSELTFELLVIRDGYSPTFVKKVDPLKGPAQTAILTPRTPVDDPKRVVRGRLVDSHGLPVRDAVIEPVGVSVITPQGESSMYGTIPGLEPVSVSDAKGEFELSHSQPSMGFLVRIEPRGLAEKVVPMPTSSDRQTIALGDGVLLRGRLVDHGKPVASAEIGLYPQGRAGYAWKLTVVGDPYSEMRIGTQEDGTFVIPNVPAGAKWYVYGRMSSIAARGAAGPRKCATATDGSELDLGDLEIQPALHFSGTVSLSDNAPIAPGMRAYIQFKDGWDSQQVPIAPDGRFEFAGLAPGEYEVWTAVRGYAAIGDESSNTIKIDHDIKDFAIRLARR